MPAIGGSNAAPAGNGGGGGVGGGEGNPYAEIEQRLADGGVGGAGGGNYGYYTNTANAIVTDAWGNWNFQYMLTSNASNATTMTAGTGTANWITWNTTYQEGVVADSPPQAELTAAQQERREQADRVMRQRHVEDMERAAERTREATAARARAEELLIEMLSDEQRATYEQQQWFAVRGSESGRVYRIGRGTVNNVSRLSADEQNIDRVLCAHPPEIPDADCHLAQMLLLVTNESEFVRIANHHGVAGYDAVLPENREAYRAERQAARDADAEHRRAAAAQYAPAPAAPEHTVEGVPLTPVVIGIDVFPDARQLDHELGYFQRPVARNMVQYNDADVAYAVHAFARGEDIHQEIREAIDPRYAPDHR